MNRVIAISVIPPSAPLPESWRGCANPSRICRVVGSARVVGIMWIQAACPRCGARESSVSPQQRSRCSRIRQSRRRRVQLVGSFMHSFVVPNASWIAVVVAFSELAIGIGLAFGFLTVSPRSPAWRCSSRTSCRVRQCLRLLRTVRDHRARHVAHVDVDWRRRIIAGYKQRRHHVVPVEVVAVVTPVPELVSSASQI